MFLSEEQATLRLRNQDRFVNGVLIKPSNNNVYGHGKEVPDFIKALAIVDAKVGAGVTRAAETFGLSEGYLSEMSRNVQPPNESVQTIVKATLEQVGSKALDKCNAALEAINADKLSEADAKALASIAKNLSDVHNNTLPKQAQGSNVSIVVYSPQIKTEEDFDSIPVVSK